MTRPPSSHAPSVAPTTRRRFLSLCGGAAALPFLATSPLGRAAAGLGAGERRLVVLRLGGGNDGLNTVIPFHDDRYHRARPTLRVDERAALPLDDHLAFHPSMADLHRLFHDGVVAVVNSVGYPNPDRSHFLSMDIWHSAEPDPSRRRTGWLGRAGERISTGVTPPTYAVIDGELPLAVVGDRGAAPAIGSIDELTLREPTAADLATAPRDAPSPALQHALAAARAAVETGRRVRSGGADPTSGFPGSSLGRDLATVTRLIDADDEARLFYVAHDGFDTHTRQKDNHAALLSDLSRSVAAFFAALKRLDKADEVLLVTFSEFGRRVRENGSLGTDHGAAGPMLAVSGALRPGVLGGPPDLDDLDDGDIRHEIDYRRVYATLLDGWLGIDAESVLGRRFEPLALL